MQKPRLSEPPCYAVLESWGGVHAEFGVYGVLDAQSPPRRCSTWTCQRSRSGLAPNLVFLRTARTRQWNIVKTPRNVSSAKGVYRIRIVLYCLYCHVPSQLVLGPKCHLCMTLYPRVIGNLLKEGDFSSLPTVAARTRCVVHCVVAQT